MAVEAKCFENFNGSYVAEHFYLKFIRIACSGILWILYSYLIIYSLNYKFLKLLDFIEELLSAF